MGMFDFLGDKKSDQTMSDLVVPGGKKQPQQTPAWATAPAVAQEQPAWAAAPVADQQQPAWASAPAAEPVVGNPDSNIRKFLNFLSKAEGHGYNTITGGSTFSDFSKHPRVVGVRTKEGPSTAAGAYGITATTYDDVAPKLGITDFSETSQDKIAIELIRRKGALNDVAQGNWEAAISKLGGIWASLPSSPYSQSKRSWEWSYATLNGTPPPPGYKPFAEVRKNVDPASLNKDPDWIRASMLMYELYERKPFQGTPEEAADYGKNGIAAFNWDLVSMAEIAHRVATSGTQEQKEAFLYMLDTYDNTNVTWEGTGRAFKHALTDPTNIIGVGTLGVATVGKFVGRKAAVTAAKEVVQKSLTKTIGESVARTGIVAGIDTGVAAAATDATRQGLEIDAGRRQERDYGQTALQGGAGFAAGLVVGSAADLALGKIMSIVRGRPEVPKPKDVKDRVEPTLNPEARVETPQAPKEPVVNPQARGAAPEGKAAEAKAPESPLPKSANDNLPEGRDPNLGSTLTPEELRAAQARRQEGRLPEDQNVPPIPKDTPRIDIPEVNSGARQTSVNMDEQGRQAAGIVDQLRQVGTKDLPAVLEQVRQGSYTLDQVQLVSRGVSDYAKELKVEMAEIIKKLNAKDVPAETVQQLQARMAELEARDSAILADDAIGSLSGSLLRQRQESLPGMTGITPETIMKEQKVTKEKAQEIWADMVSKAEQTAEAQKVAAAYDARAKAALDQGDLVEAAKIAAAKHKEISGLVEQTAPGSAGIWAKMTEWAISNVFTVKTVMVNLIPSGLKTLVIPGLKGILSNPFEKATRAEMMGAYSAMVSNFKPALQAAVAAYRYEQAILTRGSLRLLESELAIRGWKGGVIRFFPRILNASDEFLSRINYSSFVAGRAAAEATIAGTEKGMTGKALNEFVDREVKKAMDAALKPAKGDDLVMPIINKGQNLGLTGDDLWKFVEREAARNPEALRKATDEEAVNFVKDVLYKRDFSGKGTASKAAQAYEEAMSKFPSLKLVIGQLFFRTPIRVFEEGIRLTPGLQILAPNFVQDLAGKNGTLRQVRAQAEAMSSLAIAGAVLSLYGQGRITGDGAYSDWKQQRTRTDGPLPEPYTIRFSDGSTWSYRNFDPLATPVKIIINGLERMDRLRIREAQGEFIDKSKYDAALAYVTVGVTAVAAAIKDANLTEGVKQLYEGAQNLADPEQREGAILKWFGEKLKLAAPNTLHKIAQDNDPRIKDPVTFWQIIDQKLARPFGQDDKNIKTSFAYDVLGNPRRLSDTGSLWNVFSTSSTEERGKGISAEGQAVLTEMDRLAKVTGATFKPPTKHRELGDLDLREVLAEDGKRTLYDVWQENYRALNPDQVLYPIATAPLPDGTFKQKAAKVEELQSAMQQLQDAAFYQMLTNEQQVINRLIQKELYEAKAKSGQLDVGR